MKKLNFWITSFLILSIAMMGAIHWLDTTQVSQELKRVWTLHERQGIASTLHLALEHYRRLSGGFRKTSSSMIASIKADLKSTFTAGTAQLEKLDPTPEERVLTEKLNQELFDFMVLSSRLEPVLFFRDIYQKPEGQAAQDRMIDTLSEIKESAKNREKDLQDELGLRHGKMTQWLLAAGGSALLWLLLLMFRIYLVHLRPLRKLLHRANELKSGKFTQEKCSRLKGFYLEIENCLNELGLTVEVQRKDRQQFLTAVSNDLRLPVLPLKTSAALLASVGDKMGETERLRTAETIRCSAERLSRALDDLSDTLEIERRELRLNDKIVDLREIITDASRFLGGAHFNYDIHLTLPPLPAWASVDPQRLERVIVNLVSKTMQFLPQGGQIEITLFKPCRDRNPGAEIVIREVDKNRQTQGRTHATGPEQEILRHWVSENGFGMALADKIIRAHGGMITASGVAGTAVIFSLKLPAERVSSGMPLTGISVAMSGSQSLESASFQPMLAEEAINLGSGLLRQARSFGNISPSRGENPLEITPLK